MFLGTVFLGVKVIEYADKFEHHIVPGPHFDKSAWTHPAGVEQFYSLYFIMTGLHALHMIIGIGLMAVIAIMAWRKQFDSTYYTPVEVSGLCWHFVDIVWIFLFPLLYLIGRHYHGVVAGSRVRDSDSGFGTRTSDSGPGTQTTDSGLGMRD